ncbi:MAG TPA: aminoacyl-tRNA hydrolase [Candidatus Acidoferrales bacterium]|nr:aminoacyl-tRNA hydrolase [Candidatus Acidoferrales bacterium]
MIVGLGNVGREYEGTRHNVGFMVVDEVSAKSRKSFAPGKGEYYFSEIRYAGEEVILVKPTTFMNNSGIAVKDAMDRFGTRLEDLLVVYDDFNIPLTKLRMKKGGSDGGHNGVYSVIYHLNDDGFPRLRCGIGSDKVVPGRDMVDFVLSKFDAVEVPEVRKMVMDAADAVFAFIDEGIEIAMNRFN